MAETAIGKFLKAAREAAGMKKWALAEKSGVSHTEIHRIENGDRKNPSIKNIKAICKVLNIPIEEALKAGGYISNATDYDSYMKELYLDSDPRIIGEKIKKVRESKGINLSDLASNLNIPIQTLVSLENGESLCEYELLSRISYELGVPVIKLVSEAESADDLVRSTKSKGDELLEGLSKSEELVKTLFRAKDVSKETMDQMATYIKFLLEQQGISTDD